MSVQRFDSYGYMPSPEGKNMRYADHARIVAERVAEVTDALIDARREALAELEQAHAAALAEAVSVIEGLADQQAMYDGWYVEPLERLRAAAAAATEHYEREAGR